MTVRPPKKRPARQVIANSCLSNRIERERRREMSVMGRTVALCDVCTSRNDVLELDGHDAFLLLLLDTKIRR